jgi:hypothetical protein
LKINLTVDKDFILRILFLPLLICISCNKRPNDLVPKDVSNESQRKIIYQMVQEAQDYYSDIGISVNLHRFPYVVAKDLPKNVVGRCYHNLTIAIAERAFQERQNSSDEISILWTTLMHEVGHCYFQRNHEFKELSAGKDFFFKNKYHEQLGNQNFCALEYRKSLIGTLMTDKNLIFSTPISMKKYYLKELAGLIDRPTYMDVADVLELERVPREQANKRFEVISCE